MTGILPEDSFLPGSSISVAGFGAAVNPGGEISLRDKTLRFKSIVYVICGRSGFVYPSRHTRRASSRIRSASSTGDILLSLCSIHSLKRR